MDRRAEMAGRLARLGVQVNSVDTDGVGRVAATPVVPGTVEPARAGLSRWAYLFLAWVFVACVLAQIFFAGMGVFVDGSRWAWHRTFIHTFEWLPLVMLPLAFAARLSVGIRWLTGLLFGLIALQYATANAGGTFAALHPVNGLIISWVALALARGAWRAVREVRSRA
jgi:hypothetical protein